MQPQSTEPLPRFACPDWWEKIQAGETPMADVPLNEKRAAKALAFFNRLRLPDISGTPPLVTHCGDWFKEILCAFLASEDTATKRRLVWELLCMVPKKNSKTTYVAALGLTALFMEDAPNRQMLIVAPSQNISERCFAQAQGMIRLDSRLQAIFNVQDHIKRISRRKTGTKLDVKTFDTSIVTGEIPVLTIIDELHELGKKSKAAAVMQQIRGGGITMQGGQVLMITTQSDEIPAGIWKTELAKARAIRDGRGGNAPILLPVLYEFPHKLQKDQRYWRDKKNWSALLPNLGRSIDPERLVDDYDNNGKATAEAERIWVSQHLNIEMGVGMKTDGWPGAEHWATAEDETITLDSLIERSEAIVVGIDGGGLDDLYGMTVLGREPAEYEVTVEVEGQQITIKLKRWIAWSRAWCHEQVLRLRQTIAPRLRDFEAAGDIVIVDDTIKALAESVALIKKVDDSGLLACVAVDPEGPFGELVDALDDIKITEENGKVIGVPQGWKLMNAIKTTEGRLQNRMLLHAKSPLMDWCVGNVRIEPTATGIRATKQNAGDAKIDPWCALQNAAMVMIRNPEVKGRSIFDNAAWWDAPATKDVKNVAVRTQG
jgi:phage terminase large subunit-like protein